MTDEQLRRKVENYIRKWAPRLGITPAQFTIYIEEESKEYNAWIQWGTEYRHFNLYVARDTDGHLERIILHELLHAMNARLSERLSEVVPQAYWNEIRGLVEEYEDRLSFVLYAMDKGEKLPLIS